MCSAEEDEGNEEMEKDTRYAGVFFVAIHFYYCSSLPSVTTSVPIVLPGNHQVGIMLVLIGS